MNNLKAAGEYTATEELPKDLSEGIIQVSFSKTNWWNFMMAKLARLDLYRVTLTYNINPRTQSINRLE